MVDSTSALPENAAPAVNAGDEGAQAAFAKMLASERTPPEPPASPTGEAEPDAEAAASPAEASPADSGTEPDDEPSETPDDDEPDTDPSYRVKVNGEDVEVSLSELINGYTRQSDYTRKTKAAAELRTTLDREIQETSAERKALAGVRAEYQERLSKLDEALRESQGEPDWDALQQADPIEFATQYAKWQVKQQQRQAVLEEQARVRAAHEESLNADTARLVERETQKLLDAIPEWKDEAKARSDGARIRQYAESLGFTVQDLAPAQQDHRLVRLLHDAARYRELESKVKQAPTPATTKAAPAAQKAGAQKPGARPPVSEVTRAKQRLAKTHNPDDAAPFFLRAIQADDAAKRR